jgi:hypothetical protein
MKKLHVLSVVLAALFAFGVLTAASASAVTFLLAEWLKNGVGITVTELIDIESGPEAILLEELASLLKIDIVCHAILDGSIGPNGADDITELLTPEGVRVDTELLVEPALVCIGLENCPEPLLWLDNLEGPWLTLAELMVDGTEEFFVDLITTPGFTGPGYHLDCMNGTSDLCTSSEAITKLTNEANGTVDVLFQEAFTELAGLKLAVCTLGGETGIIEGLGIMLLTGGGSLSVSSS